MLLNNKNCSNCHAYYDPTLKKCPICHKGNELYELRRVPKNVLFFHPTIQIALFLIGFAYGGMFLTEFIAALFVVGFGAEKELANALLNFITYFLLFGVLIFVCLISRMRLFVKSFIRPFDYLFGLAYAGAMIGAVLLIGFITSHFYQDTNANQTAIVNMIHNYPILAGVVICFLGPVVEELAYRVGLYSFLRRINIIPAMIVTAIIFAFIHFDFTAENMVAELWSLPSYLACGVLLSLAYEHRGPACAITAHIAYNVTSMVIVLLESAYGQ